MRILLIMLLLPWLGSAQAAQVFDGVDVPEMAHFDTAAMSFMEQNDIPDAQVAVTWQGRLIFARSYTHNSDRPTTINSNYRIASVSKPLTSTLIHRAHQDGLLSIDDSIGQYLDLSTLPGQTADPRLAGVTIRNLLQHLGGFGSPSEYGFDPVFNDQAVASAIGAGMPVLKTHILRYMNGRNLIHEPGTQYAYSNYGYMLLGMILEQVSGLPYGAYADQVLNPVGIYDARQSRSQKHRLYSGEAEYISAVKRPTVLDNSGTVVPIQYGGLNHENNSSYGGWTISAAEVVRWLANLDDPGAPDAILDSSTLNMMFNLPENFQLPYNNGDYYYASGWSVRDYGGGSRNTWHNGSLPGTNAYAVRLRSGLTYAVLINKRNESGGAGWHGEIDRFMANAIGQVTQWPTHDLWTTTLRATPENAGARYHGSWYDPGHNGEGFTVSVIDPETAVIYWFTYDREGQQRWYFGVARLDGHRMVVDTLLETRGGRFGPGFDPDTVGVSEVGSLVLSFFDDGGAKADYLLKGDSGFMELSRLSTPFTSDDPATAGNNWRNGLWYDPTHNGEGYVVEALPNGQSVIYWFTYDKDGNPAWMVGSSGGATLQDGVPMSMSLPEGGNFGVGFDPANVNLISNGTATIRLRCDGASTAEYGGGDGRFPQVTLNLEPLATYMTSPCP